MKMPNFVIIEGPDGCGKTTVARALVERMGGLYLADPGSTPLGERLREILLDPKVACSSLAQCYMFTAARAESLRLAAAALSEGRSVVYDRGWPSTLVYQGYAEGVDRQVIRDVNRQLYQQLPAFRRGTLVLLSTPRSQRLARINYRGGGDRFESAPEEQLAIIEHAYKQHVPSAASSFDKLVRVLELDNKQDTDLNQLVTTILSECGQ